MSLKDIKDRLTHAVETENPSGTDYYGAELDEDDVAVARERMEKSIATHDHAAGNSDLPTPFPKGQ